MNNWMIANDLRVNVHLPPAPKGDQTHGLPPGCPVQLHAVDEYPGCPADWMHGSAVASSYFMEVKPDRHLWLDLRPLASHTHEVAAVMSVQRLNPMTRQPESALRLEQYRTKCPVHNVDFHQDRFCPECKHTWAPQNYMATTCGYNQTFWIDGWRTGPGKIRGFLITAETARGVAAQVLKEERAFAVGIALFLSKEPKPKVEQPAYRMPAMAGGSWLGHNKSLGLSDSYLNEDKGGSGYYAGNTLEALGAKVDVQYSPDGMSKSFGISGSHQQLRARSLKPAAVNYVAPSGDMELGITSADCAESAADPAAKAEVGAGANIGQDLDKVDPNEPSFWADQPAAFLYLNWAWPGEYAAILAAGRRAEATEGALAGLMVGN